MHKLPRVTHEKSCFWRVGGKNGSGLMQCWMSPRSERKLLPRYLGKEGSLQAPAFLPKSPVLVLSQTPSFAYLFNRKTDRNQPNLRPGHQPLFQPSLAQPSPAWENGWLGSVQGPRGLQGPGFLTTDPCCPGEELARPWQGSEVNGHCLWAGNWVMLAGRGEPAGCVRGLRA